MREDALSVGKKSGVRSIRRFGVTLLEVLTCLGIVLILMALLAPAVNRARETARATQCSSNLRQLGLGIAQYQTIYGVIPAAFPDGEISHSSFSPQVRILPFIGQEALYERINLEQLVVDPYEVSRLFELWPVARNRVAAFLCPSDGIAGAAPAANSYRVCTGTKPTYYPVNDGAFGVDRYTKPGEVTDGLSKTVFMSERLVHDVDFSRFQPDRDVWFLNRAEPSGLTDLTEFFMEACSRLSDLNVDHDQSVGLSWFGASMRYTNYHHVLPPNHEIPDCGTRKEFLSAKGLMTARSLHDNTVHCLFGDGAVRRVSQQIDLLVWRALATRSGGETVADAVR